MALAIGATGVFILFKRRAVREVVSVDRFVMTERAAVTASYDIDPSFLPIQNLKVKLDEAPETRRFKNGIFLSEDRNKGCFNGEHYFHILECLLGAHAWYVRVPRLEGSGSGYM